MEWGLFYWKEDKTGNRLIWNTKKVHAFTGIGSIDPKTACGRKPELGAVRVERQRTVSDNPNMWLDVTFIGFLDSELDGLNMDMCSKCMRKLNPSTIPETKDKHWIKLEEAIAEEKAEEARKAALPPLDPNAWGFVKYKQELAHEMTKLTYFEWLETQGFEQGSGRIHEVEESIIKATKELNGIDKVRDL